MKDQHTKISGYRDLSQEEIDSMNELKQLEARTLSVMSKISDPDGRWLAIGRTHIEQGFMAAIRSIAKPQPTIVDD